MKTAIVHDWLVTYGGAEKVLEELLYLLPGADVFSMVEFLPEDQRAFLGGRTVTTSAIQRLPGARTAYRRYLPLMPLAVEQFDLGAYDLVVSSSYAVAKGVITGPDQVHVSYVHSPMRYAWDLQHEYLRDAGLDRGVRGLAARALLHYLRLWDARSALGVDHFVANSDFIARRIRKTYRRDAVVVHPPVDVDAFAVGRSPRQHYVTASRLVGYKKVDVVVDAFALLPDRRLVVLGDGPELDGLRRRAGPNVEILGFQPLEVLRGRLASARAFLFAAEEDFGIAPLEAQACGTPVIAYGRGGALESVRPLGGERPTGLFFEQRSPAAVAAAVRAFEAAEGRFDPDTIRAHAETFGKDRFRQRMAELLTRWTGQAVPAGGA